MVRPVSEVMSAFAPETAAPIVALEAAASASSIKLRPKAVMAAAEKVLAAEVYTILPEATELSPVPPLATGRTPLTSEVRTTSEAVIAEAPCPLSTPVRPVRVMPVKVGLAAASISCGPESVIEPAAFVTVTRLAVPVSVAAVGAPEPSPIRSCPLVSTPNAPTGLVPLPYKIPPEVSEAAPVPPFPTATVPVTFVALPLRSPTKLVAEMVAPVKLPEASRLTMVLPVAITVEGTQPGALAPPLPCSR